MQKLLKFITQSTFKVFMFHRPLHKGLGTKVAQSTIYEDSSGCVDLINPPKISQVLAILT
jgi:hypothetical protein